MELDRAVLPGFLAVREISPALVPAAGVTLERTSWGPTELCTWGLETVSTDNGLIANLSRVTRESSGLVSGARIGSLLTSEPSALTRLLPPFAAIAAREQGVTMVADAMGFQHLFHSLPAAGVVPFMSSSSLVAGSVLNMELDEAAVGIQSLLGWQLGQRTLMAGIEKLSPGSVADLNANGLRTTPVETCASEPITLKRAVEDAANLLRTSLNALLDDHPEAVLQLTGGMDSRLLLSAIPESRRRGLRAMTLQVPGTGDVAIASGIANRYGIQHEVHGLSDVSGITPADAWKLCVANAIRLDAMSDPVALSAQRIAERSFPQGVRISGLGGEIARGFYYVGRVRDRGYTRRDAERLAAWRMFVNEAVEPGLLTDEFSNWARDVANTQVEAALRAGGDEWFRAADNLYVRHRMQRWAGATDTAVSDQRIVINPMLDFGFLDIARRLAPCDKAGSRFLGALQMELDPELGRLPLEGRPSPSVYAAPPPWQPIHNVVGLAKRVARKASQRIQRGNRPPAGGAVIAGKVAEQWREQPEVLERLGRLPFMSQSWLGAVLNRDIEPRPSSVAFIANLAVATSSYR